MPEKSFRQPLVRGRRLVRGDDVQQLVAHHPVDALVGGRGLVDVLEGLDADRQVVGGHGRRAGVAVVVEVLEEDGHRLTRCVIEELLVKVERVGEAVREVGEDVLVVLVHVDDQHVVGLE